MKKYRMELAILAIFFGLLVSLLWGTFGANIRWLPPVLLGACVAVLVACLVPWKSASPDGAAPEEGEKYAPRYFAQSLVACVIGIAVFAGIAAILNRDRFTKTFDLTQNKVNSLSPETEKFLASLDKEIHVFCVGAPQPGDRYCDDNFHLRSMFGERSAKFKHLSVGFDDREALNRIRPNGFSRLVLVSQDNKSEVVGQVTESKLTNALINLVKSKKTVYFLTGSGEPGVSMEGGSRRSYAGVAELMKDRAYEVKEHPLSAGDFPDDAQLVVAGSGRVAYTPVVENMLRRFLARGGKLILTVNPFGEPGLGKLLSDIGIRVENTILINNGGATPLGQQLARLNVMRHPIAIGDFSRESGITSVFNPREVMLAEGARPLAISGTAEGAENAVGLKLKHLTLMSAVDAAPATTTEAERARIPQEGPHTLSPDAGFDPKKRYPVGVLVTVESASKLAEGLPATQLALRPGEGSGGLMGTPAAGGNEAAKPADATKPGDGAKSAEAKKSDESQVLVLGFELANPFEQATVANQNLLPVAVAELYQDKELVSIPTKDFAPKQFSLDKNPGGYLTLFSGFLPISTALMGLYIWARRRSA